MLNKIFQKRIISSAIIKNTYSQNNAEYQNQIRMQLNVIDNTIGEVTKALLEAHAVSLKSAFSFQNNWLSKLQRKIFLSAANESASWHRDRLFELHKKRKLLQDELDKINGVFWSKKIIYFSKLIILVSTIILILWIIFMGILTALYLLPIWGTILLAYIFTKRKSTFKGN